MKKLAVSLFIFLYSAVYANSAEPDRIDQQIINSTYNDQFDAAKKLCLDQISTNQNSPKYYYYLINVKILEYYKKISELDPSKREEGRKNLNEEIINYCENVVDKIDESGLSVENKFYYGTIYAYLARVYGVDNSWWSAFKSGKKAKNFMQDVIKSDPQFFDAYLVLGMIEYYADRMNGVAGFIAGILGLSGSRETGLYYLRTAYDKGKLTFGQSSLMMIEIYTSLEGNDFAALPYFEKFLNRFPQNRKTLNAYCQTLMNLWNFKKAEELIKNDRDNLIDDYAKARFYDMTGNSALAIRYGEKALLNEKNLYRGGAAASRYIIVLNCWLTGDNDKAKKYEPLLSERYKIEFYAAQKNEKEKKWLREFSVKIAQNRQMNDIENYLKTKPDFSRVPNYEDEFNLLAGAFYFKNNLYNRAAVFFEKSVESKDERDKVSAAGSLVEIYLRENVNKSKVENLLKIIDNIDSSRLSYRSKDLAKKYNL